MMFASTPSWGCTLEAMPRPMVHATVTPIACLNLLRFGLKPYPDVQIVLSTSWVRWRGYEHARDLLPTELARRCMGATFHKQMNRDAFLQMPRGLQIWLDVERRMPSTWQAIDDDHSDWPDWCQDRLVRRVDNSGISRPKVRSAFKNALAKTFGRT